MKSVFTLGFVLLLAHSVFSQSVWKEISVPAPGSSPYAFVDFNDSLHGLLCTADGYLTLTCDGGRTWTPSQKVASSGTVFKAKMADSGTALLAVNPDQGNTKVFRITHAGAMKDSLVLPTFLNQSKYYGKGTISILNPHLIGYVTLDTSQYFISTKNFGSSWDTVSFDREFRSVKLLAVEALDSLHFFIGASAAGVGLGAGGCLYKSDDGMKTVREIPTTPFETIGMKFFTNEFACFGMTHSFDMTPSASDIFLYNSVTKQSLVFSGFGRALFAVMGTLFRDGSNYFIPTSSCMRYQGNGIYQAFSVPDAGDSLKFSALAIGAKNSYWYLTEEGRLFTSADNPLLPQGYFPLQTGNLWQYESDDPMHHDAFETKITGDTLLENGKRYAVFSGGMLGSPYLRQEGSKLYGYDVVDAQEYAIGDYAAKANDTLSQHRSARLMMVAGGKRTGTPLTWRFLEYMNIGPGSYVLNDWTVQDSIGLVHIMQEPGNAWSLTGAIIDGKTIGTITAVADQPNMIPSVMSLHQNYPNPFNPSTTISFDVPKASHLRLAVYDLLGREVAVLADGIYAPGRHQAVFQASAMSSGIYFYRLSGEGFTSVKKMLLAK